MAIFRHSLMAMIFLGDRDDRCTWRFTILAWFTLFFVYRFYRVVETEAIYERDS